MANVYSVNLYATSALPSSPTTLFTVPAGFVYVVRNVTGYNGAVRTTPVTGFLLQLEPQAAVFAGVGSADARPQRVYSWDTHVVIPTGGSVTGSTFATEAGAWHVTVSGYKLTLP